MMLIIKEHVTLTCSWETVLLGYLVSWCISDWHSPSSRHFSTTLLGTSYYNYPASFSQSQNQYVRITSTVINFCFLIPTLSFSAVDISLNLCF